LVRNLIKFSTGFSVKDLLGLLEGKEVGKYPYPSLKEVEETFRIYFW